MTEWFLWSMRVSPRKRDMSLTVVLRTCIEKKKEKESDSPDQRNSRDLIELFVIESLWDWFRSKKISLIVSLIYTLFRIGKKISFVPRPSNFIQTSRWRCDRLISSPRDSIASRASPPVPTLHLPPFFYFRTIDEPENGRWNEQNTRDESDYPIDR